MYHKPAFWDQLIGNSINDFLASGRGDEWRPHRLELQNYLVNRENGMAYHAPSTPQSQSPTNAWYQNYSAFQNATQEAGNADERAHQEDLYQWAGGGGTLDNNRETAENIQRMDNALDFDTEPGEVSRNQEQSHWYGDNRELASEHDREIDYEH